MPPSIRKILYVMDIFGGDGGGTEGQVKTLIENRPAGVEVELWLLQHSDWMDENEFPCPVRELKLPKVYDPRYSYRLRAVARRIRTEGFDLVQAFHSDTCTWAPVLARIADVPCITSRRDLGYWQTPRVLEVLRRVNRYADGVIANAEAAAQRTIEVEQCVPEQVFRIGNGHPPERFEVDADPGWRARYGIPADVRLIGLVANYRPLKRHEDLVRALAMLGRKLADVHVVLLGMENPGWAGLRALAVELGVSERLHIPTEACDDPIQAMAHFDLGVLCSESEGLSNAIIEYLGMGLPVVATAVGGNVEMVEDRVNGFLYTPGDLHKLSEGITRVLGKPGVAEKLGAESRKRYEARYTVERMVGDTFEAYARIVERRRKPSGDLDIRVEVVRDLGQLRALREPWTALLDARAFFQSTAWVETWFEVTVRRPFVLVARLDDEVVGLWPLDEEGGTLSAAGQELGADHLDVPARKDIEVEVAVAMLRHLRQVGFSRLTMRHVREGGPLRAALRRLAGDFAFTERYATICPGVEGVADWPSYFRGVLSSKHRTNLRRNMDAYLAREDTSVDLVTSEEGVPAAIERLFAIHAVRSDALRRESSFEGEQSRRVHAALARRLAREDGLHLMFLTSHGKDVAAGYGFKFKGRLYAFQSGIAPDAATPNPGVLYYGIVLEQHVFGEGLAEFDFLDGTEAYKSRWATVMHRVYDIEVRPANVVGTLKSATAGLVRLLKDEVKRRLGRDGPNDH